MMPLVFLGLLIGVPVLLALLLRVNAVFLFLSLAVGELLVRYLGGEVLLAVNAFVRGEFVSIAVPITLLLGPVVLTLFILRKTLTHTRILVQLVPLLFVGLAIASLVVPLLPAYTQQEIYSQPLGDVLRQSQAIIIAVAAVLSLLLAWQAHKPHGHRTSKRGRKL